MIKIKPLKLEQNLHLLAKHNDDVDVVWIYGSMVDGTATETSDVDIAIAFCHFPDDPLEQQARPDILASAWMKSFINSIENYPLLTSIKSLFHLPGNFC
jgi:predicted nucleotidyltransferase